MDTVRKMPVPSFHGFENLQPGMYAAIIDVDGIGPDENGSMRIPYIYNPGGNPLTADFRVTVGFPS